MANFDFKETFLNPIFKGNPISVLEHLVNEDYHHRNYNELYDDTDTVRNGVSQK